MLAKIWGKMCFSCVTAMESMTLTLKEVKENLTTVDFTKLPKPARNKGGRGQLL